MSEPIFREIYENYTNLSSTEFAQRVVKVKGKKCCLTNTEFSPLIELYAINLFIHTALSRSV